MYSIIKLFVRQLELPYQIHKILWVIVKCTIHSNYRGYLICVKSKTYNIHIYGL